MPSNKDCEHGDAYIAMQTTPHLNLPEVYVTQTYEQSSTNQGDNKNKVSNRSMEHCGACKAIRIKSFLISQTLHREIRKHKEKRGSVIRGVLIFFRSRRIVGLEDTSEIKTRSRDC